MFTSAFHSAVNVFFTRCGSGTHGSPWRNRQNTKSRRVKQLDTDRERAIVERWRPNVARMTLLPGVRLSLQLGMYAGRPSSPTALVAEKTFDAESKQLNSMARALGHLKVSPLSIGEPTKTKYSEAVPVNSNMTMAEAARELRKSRRWLQDWLRDHPVDAAGIPFYAPLGRTKTFSVSDLERIRATAREEERCRLNSSRPGKAKRRTTPSGAPTSEVYVERTAGTPNKKDAGKTLDGIKRAIERGEYAAKAEPAVKETRPPTFANAALAYLRAGGEGKYISPIIEATGEHALRDKLLSEIDQMAIDNAASALYPNAPARPPTVNSIRRCRRC